MAIKNVAVLGVCITSGALKFHALEHALTRI